MDGWVGWADWEVSKRVDGWLNEYMDWSGPDWVWTDWWMGRQAGWVCKWVDWQVTGSGWVWTDW